MGTRTHALGKKLFYKPFCLDEISFRRDYKSCQVGVVVVVRRSSLFDVPHLWKLCDGITSVILELPFWDLVHCLLISFCFGSEILKKIRPPKPPKKTKKPKKRLMDFHDGISCQRFELEGWDLVHCLLISFCFGSEILKKTPPPKKKKKKKKKS